MARILVTGYAGFIGSNLTRNLFKELKEDDELVGLDCYTYAARPQWVFDGIPISSEQFKTVKVDLRDFKAVLKAIASIKPTHVYHLAAESHVCRSIEGPRAFVETNVVGTFNLIEALRQTSFSGRMVHVSTDETFGQLSNSFQPKFQETTLLEPTSPYSSSKASSDLLVRAYAHTYGLDAMITRCTNNYGPNQHEEKLIPKTIVSILDKKPVTVYGTGKNMRDWIYVDDHCSALQTVMSKGVSGEIYCVGSGLELQNIEVIERVAYCIKKRLKVVHTDDRPTDDLRYAVRTDKLEMLGWKPRSDKKYFTKMILETIDWYKKNREKK